MLNPAGRNPEGQRRSRRSKFAIGLAVATLFIVLGGSAAATSHLIRAKDIAKNAVTGKHIRNSAVATRHIHDGAVRPQDLHWTTRDVMKGDTGAKGDPGEPGETGPPGVAGEDGADGANGILAPVSATAGLTPLPTAAPPTVVISMAVPAGDYVVLAKTQLSHTGAGDSVDCALKAGSATVDQVSMKTLPALAAIPVALQAVTTTSPTQLSVECSVLVANGAADHSSLIALPTG